MIEFRTRRRSFPEFLNRFIGFRALDESTVAENTQGRAEGNTAKDALASCGIATSPFAGGECARAHARLVVSRGATGASGSPGRLAGNFVLLRVATGAGSA